MIIGCFGCAETIDTLQQDYFTIQKKSLGFSSLYFHDRCFEDVAGTQYTEALKNTTAVACLVCKVEKSTNGKKTCDACTKNIPPCPSCNAPMTVRVNKNNFNIFYGCTTYPVCKKTRKVK